MMLVVERKGIAGMLHPVEKGSFDALCG